MDASIRKVTSEALLVVKTEPAHGYIPIQEHMVTTGIRHNGLLFVVSMCLILQKSEHRVEGHVPQGVRVQVPLSALNTHKVRQFA